MSKQEDLASRIVSNTEEQRTTEVSPEKREARAQMEMQLVNLRCRSCNSVGRWVVVRKAKIIRYVKCTACGRTSAIPISGDATRTLRPSDLAKLEKANKV